MSTPFWKADPAVWPLIAEGLAKPWAPEVAREDLRWWVDQLDVGRARALPGRPALAARWGWKDCAVRKLLAEVDPLGQRSPRQPDASATPAGRHTRGVDRAPEHQSTRAPETETPLDPPAGGHVPVAPERPATVEPDDDPADAALPAWSAGAFRDAGRAGYGGTRSQLVQAVADVLEVIQGRPGASAVFSAADVGAPHLRRRTAIIAHLPDTDGAGRHEPKPVTGRGRTAIARDDGAAGAVADADAHRREGLATCGAGARLSPRDDAYRRCMAGWDHRPAQPRVGGAADGIPGGLDRARWEADVPRVAPSARTTTSRLAALGNAVVPRWAYAVGLRVAELEAQRCARRTA